MCVCVGGGGALRVTVVIKQNSRIVIVVTCNNRLNYHLIKIGSCAG